LSSSTEDTSVPSPIQRFSSRRESLDQSFLSTRLEGAKAYDRIAGYFSSSLLEIAGETLESVDGPIRIVCNSDLDERDVQTARAAKHAMRQEWCASNPETFAHDHRERFRRLYALLRGDHLQVKVLPKAKFGLAHGKAGVITRADGSKTSFLGSANSTASAWTSNYELLWEDASPESVRWVQDEFEALWTHTHAVDLADFVVEDIGRIAERTVIQKVEEWQDDPDPASAAIELPVFREGFGLWEHQKYFVKKAFDAHRKRGGARFVLADMVGLGKTLQLTLSALLMALHGDKPILVLAPKTLRWQWQEEMTELLDMPSAVWNSQKKCWIDENGIEHPSGGHEGIRRCPRRVGIVSQGLITYQSEAATHLQRLEYECIMVDEAHKARRRNRNPFRPTEKPNPNNLMQFLLDVSSKTKSMLLATATPVQLHALEGWDLLHILAQGDDSVLGNPWSRWREADQALDVVMGEKDLPNDDWKLWEWVRNPLPPADEDRTFEILRRSLRLDPEEAVAKGDAWDTLSEPDRHRVRRIANDFARHHNPFIRHIVRRTREFLETTIDPETGEPYMDPIEVELHGESADESIPLPAYLEDAYSHAEKFCSLLGERMQAAGFMQTLLLRRMGSTIYAGQKSAGRILDDWTRVDDPEVEYSEDNNEDNNRTLTAEEESCLHNLVEALEANRERDPKYQHVVEYLLGRNWLQRGCIIFSQYFESVWWLASQLSEDDLPDEKIGIYAAREKSGIMQGGEFILRPREDLKQMVRRGELRLLIGTESASEGLNLQRLSTLINLDLPWNPTRLEQRKGRIQRIGQQSDTIHVYNMRYRDSVEDRVHELLSERMQNLHTLFGQIPDTIETAWKKVAVDKMEEARREIDAVPTEHPFEMRYEQINPVDWESCTDVLEDGARRERLSEGW
jgi:superfamily II DNA or RNA helicase